MDKEYDLIEVIVNSDNSDSNILQIVDNDNMVTNNVNITYKLESAITHQAIDNDILDKLFMSYIRSKST